MATLESQEIVRTGLEATYVAAAASGDEFVNTGDEFVHLKNGDSGSHTVTIATPATVDTLAVADRTVVVPASEDRMFGPFPSSTYNDGANKVQLTYDAEADLTIAIIKQGS